MSVPADNSRKNNANVVKRFKLSKKHFANVWSCGKDILHAYFNKHYKNVSL